jgi:hypothetical protein
MKFLWTTSDKVGARLIRWGLGSDCSHFAICFDEDIGGIVFHSHGKGPQLEWLGEFLKKNHVVHALTFKTPLALMDEEDIYRKLVASYSSNRYDYPALLWWAWRGFLNKLFGIPITKENHWQQRGMSLCTNLAGAVRWISKLVEEQGRSLEMVSPHELYAIASNSDYLRQTTVGEKLPLDLDYD